MSNKNQEMIVVNNLINKFVKERLKLILVIKLILKKNKIYVARIF